MRGNMYPFNIYVVGGAIRDCLNGEEPHDIDFVVEPNAGKTQETIDILNSWFGEKIGKSFPVWRGPIGEIALTRTEKSTGDGHSDFDVNYDSVAIEDDLRRRDFTINAIAIKIDESKNGELPNFIADDIIHHISRACLLENSNVIDPFHGISDFNEKRIRAVSSHFAEDPLRVFRLARFAAKYPEFTINPSTMNMCRDMVELNMLSALPGERIFEEVKKSLKYQFYKFIMVLRDIGLYNTPDSVIFELKELESEICNEPFYRYVRWYTLFNSGWVHRLLIPKETQYIMGGRFYMDMCTALIEQPGSPQAFRIFAKYKLVNFASFANDELKYAMFHMLNHKYSNALVYNRLVKTLRSIVNVPTVDIKPGPEYGNALYQARSDNFYEGIRRAVE